ncbi:MAG: hypothetical protein OEZ06_19680 [Myxococcales bacterium]|nr:hypothetical protein [Myxococcales bacterium]
MAGFGCAADSSGGRGDARSPLGSAGTATGAAGGGASVGMFGNTTSSVSEVTPTGEVIAADECADGERCGPTGLDPNDCGNLTLNSDAETIEMPGNLLVIFDRSGSMNQNWDTRTKSQAAGEALQAALDPLKDLLTVGAVLFPSPDTMAQAGSGCTPGDFICELGGLIVGGIAALGGSCNVNPITSPDQLNFLPGPQFIIDFPNLWSLSSGSTPLGDAVVMADQAIASSTFTGEIAVVIITDGEPNCGTDMNQVNMFAANWLSQGIPTHVIGLPGAGGAANLLQQLAVTGGTGSFIEPSDPAALEARLRAIVSETIKAGIDSCDITVDPPAEDPDQLHMVVMENGIEQDVPRDLAADASWSVSADGSQISLQGQLCQDAIDGRFASISFKFGCVDLPPLPPQRPQ